MQTAATLKNTSDSAPITWGTRISYGLGDTACNIVMGITSAVLTLFYTDYVGIPAVTVRLVMLLSRIFVGRAGMVICVLVARSPSK